MSTALVSTQLMNLITARRPDLRHAQRADIVTRIIRLGADHSGIDRDASLRLSPDAEALIGTPPAPQEQPAPTPPDTSALQAELANEHDPIRRSQIRARIAIANGAPPSTKENP